MARTSADTVVRPSLIDVDSPSVEVMRTLRMALMLRHAPETGTRVVVTSAEPGAGKSTIAANLALVSGLGGSRALLIDADLAKPVQHNIFNVSRRPGLVDYLATGGDIGDFVQEGPSELDVLTAGRDIPRASEILSSSRMEELLASAAHRYDAIIVDTPPVLASADAAAIATGSGLEVLFVVARTTRRHDVTRALRRLELMQVSIAGLVLNREGTPELYGYSS